jgi:hypothetical protein
MIRKLYLLPARQYWLRRFFFPVLVTGCLVAVQAHESLYNYVEIRFPEEGGVEVEYALHAADYAIPFGVDPAETDSSWFGRLPEADRAKVIGAVNESLQAGLGITTNSPGIRMEVPVVGPGDSLSLDEGPRPGCLCGSQILPAIPDAITFTYRNPDKRLMIVVNRPGAFPEVHDLGAGESFTLTSGPKR